MISLPNEHSQCQQNTLHDSNVSRTTQLRHTSFIKYIVYLRFETLKSRKELNFNVENKYAFNKKQTLISDIFLKQYAHLLCFLCLFTPLSIKTPMTPTLLGEIFGTKKIFGAIDLKC